MRRTSDRLTAISWLIKLERAADWRPPLRGVRMGRGC